MILPDHPWSRLAGHLFAMLRENQHDRHQPQLRALKNNWCDWNFIARSFCHSGCARTGQRTGRWLAPDQGRVGTNGDLELTDECCRRRIRRGIFCSDDSSALAGFGLFSSSHDCDFTGGDCGGLFEDSRRFGTVEGRNLQLIATPLVAVVASRSCSTTSPRNLKPHFQPKRSTIPSIVEHQSLGNPRVKHLAVQLITP
ncbi:hypothetical protein ETAA8_47040 [Anatilimnocola aggregata]|uniref:Uncharacterized protein n=1 Tax=Anatilimnocola aggregata TaxID=2528021 RepID=A0A517YH87_9BACT|nr:hypothetical protein ETAA8_47040 [Anatilimnocola aggregata]